MRPLPARSMVTSPCPSSRLIIPLIDRSTSPCSGLARSATRPPSSRGLRPSRELSTQRRNAFTNRFGSGSTASRLRSTSERKCARSHGTPVNCARCVTSCSASHSRNSRGGKAKRFSSAMTFGPDVVDDVLVVGVLFLDDEQVVLAEHPRAHPAEDQAELGARRAPGERRQRAFADPFAEPLGERPQQPGERGDVRADPAGAIGDTCPSRTDQRTQTGRLRRRVPRLRR